MNKKLIVSCLMNMSKSIAYGVLVQSKSVTLSDDKINKNMMAYKESFDKNKTVLEKECGKSKISHWVMFVESLFIPGAYQSNEERVNAIKEYVELFW